MECEDFYRDRIDKLTLIAKLLKRKFEEFNFHVSRQQPSSSATDVNVHNFVVNVDNSVEWTDTHMKVIKR